MFPGGFVAGAAHQHVMFQMIDLPLLEVASRLVLGSLAIMLGTVIYVSALISIGRHTTGIAKTTLALIAYVLVATDIGSVLMWILSSADTGGIRQNIVYILVVIIAWIVAFLPSYLYIYFKLGELRAAGFFLKEKRH